MFESIRDFDSQEGWVNGRGNKKARIMIIGDAPNYTESRSGVYGSGKSYDLLKRLLTENGIDINECWYTPLIKCPKPEDGKIPAPMMKEHKAYIEMEIAAIKPEWVIVLGANPLKMMTRGSKITEVHGTTIPVKNADYKVFAAFHPAMSIRDLRHWEAIEFDFKMFGKEFTGKDKVNHKLNHQWVKSWTTLKIIEKRIRSGESYALDLECNSLQMRFPESRLSLAIIAFRDKQYVLDYEHIPFHKMQRFWERVEEHGLARGQYMATANGKFDQLWLYFKHGVRLRTNFDVNLASHLLDENSPNGLKHNARVALEIDNWDVDVNVKKGIIEPTKAEIAALKRTLKHIKCKVKKEKALKKLIALERKRKKEIQVEYAAWDGYATYKLMVLRRKQLKKDECLWPLFTNQVMPAANSYFTMETNGVVIDLEQMDVVERRLHTRARILLRKLTRLCGREINWNSGDQVNEVLFDEMELEPVAHTDKGAPSTAEDNLVKMKDQHEIISVLLEYRGVFKQLSGFIHGWKKRMIDGRLWPSFKVAGTVTGRPACGDPNLQQVPRDPLIRSLVTAPEGYVFFELDYSQAELRIAASVSGDRKMLSVFQNGGDIHESTYLEVMGMTPEEAVAHIQDPGARKAQLKEERKKAKAVNFGLIYGMGWKTLMSYADINYGIIWTPNETKQVRKRYFEVYAQLLDWHDRQRKIVRTMKQVRTLTGRIRHLPQIDSPDTSLANEAERLAINSPVQGFGAELGLMSAPEVEQYFGNDIIQMVGTIHDAIVGYVKIGYEIPALRRMQMIMQSPAMMKEVFDIDLPVPIVTDVSIGNWGVGYEMGKDFLNVQPIEIKDGVVKVPTVYMLSHTDGKYGRTAIVKTWAEAKALIDDKNEEWKFCDEATYFQHDIPF